jgi:hypothetical protein
MKRLFLHAGLLLMLCQGIALADGGPDARDRKAARKVRVLRELPGYLAPKDSVLTAEEDFKPSIHVGAIVHMFASAEQSGFGGNVTDKASDWNKGFSLYRARVLVGGQLSKKGSFSWKQTFLHPSVFSWATVPKM